MKPKLVIFDDSDTTSALLPFSAVRSVGFLRKGCFTQAERISLAFTGKRQDFCCESLESLQLTSGRWLGVNAAMKVSSQMVETLRNLPVGAVLYQEENQRVVAFHLDVADSCIFSQAEFVDSSPVCGSALYEHWWELVADNDKQIEDDFQQFYSSKDGFSVPPQLATLLNPYSVWLGKGVSLGVGAILDARAGAIVIEDGVQLSSSCLLEGPCYVGKESTIKPFAHLKGGTSVGRSCKVGGEVDGAIIDDYSNKQHYGFIGESYIGSWVNLGAGTTCSDLKNNYSQVKSFSAGKQKIETGRQFLGCVIGDYTKLGIGSLLNTGAYIGTGCSLYGTKIVEGKVGNFRFGKVESQNLYDLPKFLQTLQVVKARRGLKLLPKEKEAIEKIFNKELKNYVS